MARETQTDGPRVATPRVFLGRGRTTFIVAVFAVSRCAYLLAGVRFNANESWLSYQLLPPDLLRHDLLRSLYFLHTQPPGFNLIVGWGSISPAATSGC
jgi:hypothetical protein